MGKVFTLHRRQCPVRPALTHTSQKPPVRWTGGFSALPDADV